ncbi:MAG TPA: hypothetical protein VEN82_02235 [Actinomycetota bacterium]|nr:hypothetical protein [Actinomycetota bacterium]
MRFVRPSVVICAIAGLLAVSAASAWATATDQANGQGQTPLSAALGFNAQSDLSGNLEYNADPNGANAGFSAHCNDYTSFVLRYTKVGNYPLVKVTASCADKDGNTVYLTAGLTDRGEPGINDSICLEFKDGAGNLLIHDMGKISNGNIQIHVH